MHKGLLGHRYMEGSPTVRLDSMLALMCQRPGRQRLEVPHLYQHMRLLLLHWHEAELLRPCIKVVQQNLLVLQACLYIRLHLQKYHLYHNNPISMEVPIQPLIYTNEHFFQDLG